MGVCELPPVSTCVIKVDLDEGPQQRRLFTCQFKVPLSLLCRYCSDDGSAGENLERGVRKTLSGLEKVNCSIKC